MKTYTFKIDGMTCHACESLITMDLEEAGLPAPNSINAETGEMVMTIDDAQMDAVKQAVAASNKYTVTSVAEKTV